MLSVWNWNFDEKFCAKLRCCNRRKYKIAHLGCAEQVWLRTEKNNFFKCICYEYIYICHKYIYICSKYILKMICRKYIYICDKYLYIRDKYIYSWQIYIYIFDKYIFIYIYLSRIYIYLWPRKCIFLVTNIYFFFRVVGTTAELIRVW